MKTKVRFVKPAILQEVTLEGEGQLLAGSIVNQVEVESAGQAVHDIDASKTDTDFAWNDNWNWE